MIHWLLKLYLYFLAQRRVDGKRQNPCLTSYDKLPPSEKSYNQSLAFETLKYVYAIITQCVYAIITQCVYAIITQCVYAIITQYVYAIITQCVYAIITQCVYAIITQCVYAIITQYVYAISTQVCVCHKYSSMCMP